MPSTVVILGAAGRFGLAATQAFAAAGWRVLAQVRPGRDVARLPTLAGVEWLPASIDATAALAARAPDARIVVHGLNPRYENACWCRDNSAYLRAAMALASRLGARLMVPGNVYNFGADMPPVLTRDTPQSATDAKGRARIAMEAELAAACATGELRGVLIRAGDFFGSGRGSWFDEVLAKDLWRARVNVPAAADVPHAWAYLPDLARAFVRVTEREAELPPYVALGFAGHTVTIDDWLRQFTRITRRLGWLGEKRRLTVRGLPWRLMRLAGWFAPRLQALTDMRHLWQRPHRIDGTDLAAVIGAEPHTPFDLAVEDAVAELYPHALEPQRPLGPHAGAGGAA